MQKTKVDEFVLNAIVVLLMGYLNYMLDYEHEQLKISLVLM